MNYIEVITTIDNRGKAEDISKSLISERLAACVQIIDNVNSYFMWKGKLNINKEIMIIVKTKKSMYGLVENLIRKKHSYENPEIISLPILDGSKEYFSWIDQEVKDE